MHAETTVGYPSDWRKGVGPCVSKEDLRLACADDELAGKLCCERQVCTVDAKDDFGLRRLDELAHLAGFAGRRQTWGVCKELSEKLKAVEPRRASARWDALEAAVDEGVHT